MLAHNYDPNTFLYVSSCDADESPLEPGVFLLPAHSTATEPPTCEDDFIPMWTGSEWTVVPKPEPPKPADNEVAPPPEPWPEDMPDWAGFYDSLLVSSCFAAARAAAATDLATNVAYTDCAAALGLARQGAVNVPAIQAALDALLGLVTLSEEQQTELDGLISGSHVQLTF